MINDPNTDLARDFTPFPDPIDDDSGDMFEREDRLKEDGSASLEPCVLVGVEDLSYHRMSGEERDDLDLENQYSLTESLTEMRDLTKTAGLRVVSTITQRLNDPNPRTYIGTGKTKEIAEVCKRTGVCTVVFDAELSPRQLKHLENVFGETKGFRYADSEPYIKVIDRTALILDIFAQHAKTAEGQLQVELALHTYRAPRLTKLWTHLERQSGAGGVGLRGPGERQLEIDKRLLRDKINGLKKQIDEVQKQRDLHRRGRSNLGLPVVALVGYTNAGKSTLLNYLTSAGVMAEDILFATLDPTTRRVKLPGLKTHPEVLLTDTVGFIQKLPTQLVAAFRATLEEVKEADILLHVMDVSNPIWSKQEAAVMEVLNDIGCGDKPMLKVFNKIDLVEDGTTSMTVREGAAMMDDNAVAVSSKTGEGMTDFVASMERVMEGLLVPIEVVIPYSKGEELNLIHEVGAVDFVDYREEGTMVIGKVPLALANRLQEWECGDGVEGKDQEVEEEETEEQMWKRVAKGRDKK